MKSSSDPYWLCCFEIATWHLWSSNSSQKYESRSQLSVWYTVIVTAGAIVTVSCNCKRCQVWNQRASLIAESPVYIFHGSKIDEAYTTLKEDANCHTQDSFVFIVLCTKKCILKSHGIKLKILEKCTAVN